MLQEPYKPNDDSLLLLNTLPPNRKYVLEIGAASGFIIMNYKGVAEGVRIGCDLIRTGADVICDGYHLPFRDNVFDLIFFNPPYLPSIGAQHDVAVDGGYGGIEIACNFLRESIRCIRRDGEIYTLLSTLSDIRGFINFANEIGLSVYKVEEKRLFMESLVVLKMRLD